MLIKGLVYRIVFQNKYLLISRPILFCQEIENGKYTTNPLNPKQHKLLDEIRNLLHVKHYSIRTEMQYVQWAKPFILFHHKRHPRERFCALKLQ